VDVDTGIALTVAEALKGTKHVYASIKALLDKAQPAVDTVAEAAVAREGVKYVVTGKEVDGKEAKQLLAIILEKLEQQVKPQHLPPPPPPPPAPPPPVLSSATAKANQATKTKAKAKAPSQEPSGFDAVIAQLKAGVALKPTGLRPASEARNEAKLVAARRSDLAIKIEERREFFTDSPTSDSP